MITPASDRELFASDIARPHHPGAAAERSANIRSLERLLAEKKAADEKRAATLLQSSMRGKARRAEHLKHKQERDKAAVKLQAARRGHVSRRDLKEAEAEKNKAASKVQKLYRGGHARAAAAAEKEEAEILAKLNSGESQTTGPESFKKKKKRTRSGSLPFMDRIELEGEEGEGEAE